MKNARARGPRALRGPLRFLVMLLVLLMLATVAAIAHEAKKSGRSVTDVLRDALTGKSSVFGGALRSAVVGFGLALAALFGVAEFFVGAAWFIPAFFAVATLIATGTYATTAGLLHLPQLPHLNGGLIAQQKDSGDADPCVVGNYVDKHGVAHLCHSYDGDDPSL